MLKHKTHLTNTSYEELHLLPTGVLLWRRLTFCCPKNACRKYAINYFILSYLIYIYTSTYIFLHL